MDWKIYERDVDVILAQEFFSNAEFAGEVLRRSKHFSDTAAKVVEVQVSLSDQLGESDLVVIYEKEDAARIALLIEDKIDAGFQPNQFERYRARGEAGVSDGRWRQFELVLCAPRAYVDRKELETAKFDSRFPYEEIASFLKERVQGQRGAFLDQFFLSAAPRGASAYVKIKDAATDTFWNAAFELAHTEFPELEMKQPDLARGSAWVTFRPADFPSSIYIALKGPRGFADLTFGGTTLSELNKIVQAIEKAGTTLHQTGKSAAIRMTFSPFAVADGVEAVQTKVREALGCCRALVTLYRRHRAEFEADRLPTEAIDASSRFV